MSNTNLKEPPHNAEAERAVLGSIMLDTTGRDGDRVWDICQERGLVPDAFFDPRNRVLYSTMQELSRASKPLDYVSLLEALRTNGKLEEIGGVAYIQSLYDETPTTAHAEYYIDIVSNKHLRRQMIYCSAMTIDKCHDEENYSDTKSVLGDAEKRLLEIDPANGSPGMTWEQATDVAYTRMTNPSARERGIMSGFKGIDEIVGGFERGSLIIIAARPSVGKTTLAMNIVEHVALGEERHPVGIFSLEMPTDSLTDRMIYSRARVNSWMYKNDKIMDMANKANADAAIKEATDKVRGAPIFPDDTASIDIADLRSRARRMKKQHGIELVVIDYLQLMHCRAAEKLNAKHLEIAEITGQLKAMAKELKIPVVALSQLNREGANGEPSLSNLRDSGSIEQDADVVVFLWREKETDKANVKLKVAKNRNGKTGDTNLNLKGEWYHFFDQPSVR